MCIRDSNNKGQMVPHLDAQNWLLYQEMDFSYDIMKSELLIIVKSILVNNLYPREIISVHCTQINAFISECMFHIYFWCFTAIMHVLLWRSGDIANSLYLVPFPSYVFLNETQHLSVAW